MRDVFEEMKLGFLIVGHTLEDIDGYFGYMSRKLIYIYIYMADLMKASMVLPKVIVYSSIDPKDSRF